MYPNPKPIPENLQFFMVYRSQLKIARQRIASLPSALISFQVFVEALAALHQDSGVIRLERKSLATQLNLEIDEVENAMADLTNEQIFYEADDGWKGFNKLCLNPAIAWKGGNLARDNRQKLVSPLEKNDFRGRTIQPTFFKPKL